MSYDTFKHYIVSVSVDGAEPKVERVYTDSWQSAILAHSSVGAEFEDLVDEFDLERRCQEFGYIIDWRPVHA